MTFTTQHMKINTNGTQLHVQSTGSGPAILLLHGWLGSSHHWRHVVPLLADRFQVVVPDMRGYGESAKPPAGYDGETLADDIAGVAAALGLSNYIVAGHDMGALPALLLAARPEAGARGLVYIDEPLPGYNLDRFTTFTAENPFVYWWFAFNAQPHLPAMLWAGREAELVDYFLTAMTADPSVITAADKAEYVRGLRKPGGLDASFGWYREVLTTARQIKEATEAKLPVPVLAINGQYGHPDVEAQMALVADQVTGVTLANCGHLCAEEKPKEVASAILNFAAAI
jgi:pimeloyl-ACP methyl ester carboxylesterase